MFEQIYSDEEDTLYWTVIVQRRRRANSGVLF